MNATTYHGIRKGSGHSNNHPPGQAFEELPSLAPYEIAHQPSVQLGDVEADQRPQHEEDAVPDQQPQLLALPARYANLQQPQQVLEELAVQLHLLPARRLARRGPRARPPAHFGLPQRRGLLLGYGIADACDQGDEEGEVEGARDACAVLEVQRSEVIDGL
jgi:hypothetical protein